MKILLLFTITYCTVLSTLRKVLQQVEPVIVHEEIIVPEIITSQQSLQIITSQDALDVLQSSDKLSHVMSMSPKSHLSTPLSDNVLDSSQYDVLDSWSRKKATSSRQSKYEKSLIEKILFRPPKDTPKAALLEEDVPKDIAASVSTKSIDKDPIEPVLSRQTSLDSTASSLEHQLLLEHNTPNPLLNPHQLLVDCHPSHRLSKRAASIPELSTSSKCPAFHG